MSGRSKRYLAIGFVVLMASGTGVVLHAGGASTPVPPTTALHRFRELHRTPTSTLFAEPSGGALNTSPPTGSRSGSGLPLVAPVGPTSNPRGGGGAPAVRPPQEGVYVYATTGGEQVSIPGGQHQYPAETTVTIRYASCGYASRWDALQQSWEERQVCPGSNGERLVSYTTYHEFFNRQDLRVFTCDASSLTHPPASAPAGTQWKDRCDSQSQSQNVVAQSTGVVVGHETLVVAGKAVDTIHIHVETAVSGDQTGTSQHDGWFIPSTGVSAREVATTDTDSNQPVFGSVHYHEQYEIDLTSLSPQQ